MLLSALCLNGNVVVVADDLFTDLACIETRTGQYGTNFVGGDGVIPSKANTTAVAAMISEDLARTDLVGSKDRAELLIWISFCTFS